MKLSKIKFLAPMTILGCSVAPLMTSCGLIGGAKATSEFVLVNNKEKQIFKPSAGQMSGDYTDLTKMATDYLTAAKANNKVIGDDMIYSRYADSPSLDYTYWSIKVWISDVNVEDRRISIKFEENKKWYDSYNQKDRSDYLKVDIKNMKVKCVTSEYHVSPFKFGLKYDYQDVNDLFEDKLWSASCSRILDGENDEYRSFEEETYQALSADRSKIFNAFEDIHFGCYYLENCTYTKPTK